MNAFYVTSLKNNFGVQSYCFDTNLSAIATRWKGVQKNTVKFLFVSVAKRRLAFLNKEGFDRFGNNLLFAPLSKWETFKKQVEVIRDHAREYEDAYNEIQASVQGQNDLKTILRALPDSAMVQVNKEIERLTEARRIAVSEKGVYVQARSLLCLLVCLFVLATC